MATVQPLLLRSLPSVSRAGVTRLPWSWTAVARTRATVVLAGVGAVHLSWDGFAEPGTTTAREELGLVGRDGRRGRIAVDRWFALAVVAPTLGSRAPRLLRALGWAERGVLGGLVAAALAGLGGSVMVSLDDRSVSAPLGTVSLAVRAETVDNAGWIFLDLPREWLAGRQPSLDHLGELGDRLGRLLIPVAVELATTTIQVGEWAAAQRGDAVLFEGCRFVTTAEQPLTLRVGDYAADARMDAPGSVTLVGSFSLAPSRPSPPKETIFMSATREEDLKVKNLKVIGAAPIDVVAEVGRLSLRGDEVLGLQRGSVLPLGHQGQGVSLLVGGQPWARGELVNVDGELGVRITDLVGA